MHRTGIHDHETSQDLIKATSIGAEDVYRAVRLVR